MSRGHIFFSIMTFLILLLNPVISSAADLCKDTLDKQAKADFPKLSDSAETFRKKYCGYKIGQNQSKNFMSDYYNFLDEAEITFSKKFTGEVCFSEVYGDVLKKVLGGQEVVPIAVEKDIGESVKIGAAGVWKYCSTINDMPGKKAVEKFGQVYNFVTDTIAKKSAYKLHQKMVALDKQWNDYFEKSRSQTILELAVNSSLYANGITNSDQMSPPSWQVILLHPSVVVENVRQALDGQKTKEALMLEFIGINWWEENPWYLPSGLSAVGTYSDRAGTKNWGIGGVVHFNEKFSIGYSRYDRNHDGVFVTIDLLKLIQDKQELIRTYQEKIDALRL